MKRISLFIVILIITFHTINVYADTKKIDTNALFSYKVTELRAGGGGSSGGGSSSSGGSRSHSSTNGRNYNNGYPSIFSYLIFGIVCFSSTICSYIVVKRKIYKSSKNSKKLMKILENNDNAWKYENIQKQVAETYFVVQKAWTSMKIEEAKEYMDEDLYNNWQLKIEWMQVAHKQNILKKIKLIDAEPISIHDNEDDTRDFIWYYIKGNMIDYTINTETNEKIEGNEFSNNFTEFWKFIRKEDSKWVLAKILQECDKDKIVFQINDEPDNY